MKFNKKNNLKKRNIIFLVILLILILILGTRDNNIIYNGISDFLISRMQGKPINEETGIINNEFFNINSQGKNPEDTTNGINEAIKYANQNNIKYIKFEEGVYSIDGQSYEDKNESDTKKGIILQSNITIDLNNSTFKQIANDKVNYAIFSITGVENVKIVNGKVMGDKDEHDYSKNSTHEWGFGIDIRGSKNVELSNIEIQDCTGDGIFLTNYGDYSNNASNIRIENVNIHDCRRQGISIISAEKVRIENNEIYNIDGTSPQSGIDLESWSSKQLIDEIYITNNKIYNTKNNYAIIVMGMSRNVYIEGNLINGVITCDNIKEKITINNNEINNGTISLLTTEEGISQGKVLKKVVVKNNKLQNSNLYLLNVENALIEENVITNKPIMCFKSNACFYRNLVESDNFLQSSFYSRVNNPKDEDEFHLYLYGNEYNGNIGKKEDIEESEHLIVHRNEEEIMKYKEEFE